MKNKLAISEKNIEFIQNLFAVIFMIYAILSCCGLTYGRPIIKPFMWGSFLLSAVILLYRLINIKKYFKVPITIFSLMMVGAVGISTLLNRQYSFKSNVIFCIYWAFYFLVLFTTEKNRKKENCKKTLRIAATTFTVYTTLFTVVSFILYFAGVSETHDVPGGNYTYNIGFRWGRLWGIFLNPNHGAVSCAITILFLIYVFRNRKKIWERILIVLDIGVHLLYIVFSDSRTGTVVLSIGVAIYVFAILLKTFNRKKVLTILISGVIAVGIAAGCFTGVRQIRKPVNIIISYVNSQTGDNDPDKPDDNIIDRGYDLSEDISNRRFDVWKSGVEVFTHSGKNMIFGLSYCGFTEYAQENMPDTYIVNNDYAVMITLDNEILNILISDGIFGIISAVAFIGYILVFVIIKFRKVKRDEKYFVALQLAILFPLACAAMFSSIMFYHFSPNAVMFWIVLGQLMAYLDAGEKIENV